MKKIILLITLFTFSFSIGNAQDEIRQAFSDSYQFESEEKYGAAISSLETVYETSNYIMNFRLGWLYYSKGDLLKSQSYYNNAITINPKSIEARFGYIYPTAALENWDDVINIYLEIITQAPSNTTALYRLGSIYNSRNQHAEASIYLAKVLELYPFDYDTNILMGQIELKQGNIQNAKKCFEAAMYYYPNSEELQTILKGL